MPATTEEIRDQFSKTSYELLSKEDFAAGKEASALFTDLNDHKPGAVASLLKHGSIVGDKRVDEWASRYYQYVADETDPARKEAGMAGLKDYEKFRSDRGERPYEYLLREKEQEHHKQFTESKLDSYSEMFTRGASLAHEVLPEEDRKRWLKQFEHIPNPDSHKRKALMVGLISSWANIPTDKINENYPAFMRAFRERELGIQGDADESKVFGEMSGWLGKKITEREENKERAEQQQQAYRSVYDAAIHSVLSAEPLGEAVRRIQLDSSRGALSQGETMRAVMESRKAVQKRVGPHLENAQEMISLLKKEGGTEGIGEYKTIFGIKGRQNDILEEVSKMKPDEQDNFIFTVSKMLETTEDSDVDGYWSSIMSSMTRTASDMIDTVSASGEKIFEQATHDASGQGYKSFKELKPERAAYFELKEKIRQHKNIAARIEADEGEIWSRGFEKTSYGVAGTLPYMAVAAIPYAGAPLIGASFYEETYQEINAAHPEMEEADKEGMAVALAPVLAGIERLSVRGMTKGFPTVTKWLKKAGVQDAVTLFAGRAAGGAIAETSQELIQQGLPAWTQQALSKLKEDIPEVSEARWKAANDFTNPDIINVTVTMGILGAGGRTALERMGVAKAQEVLSDEDALRLSGASQAEAKAIAAEGDAFKQQKMLEMVLDKTKEERKAAHDEAVKHGADRRIEESRIKKHGTSQQKAALEAKNARADYIKQYGATIIENRDGTATVTYGESSIKADDSFDSVESAVTAADVHNQETHEGYLNELRTSSDNIEAMRETVKKLKQKHEGAEVKRSQDLQSPAEFAAESAANMEQMLGRVQIMLDHAGIERGATVADLEQARVLGEVQLREKARGYIARIAKDGNVATVIEEGSEGWLRDSIRHGIIDSGQVKQELIDYQSFSGDTFTKATTGAEMSDQEMVEGFSRLAKAHMFNKGQEGAIQGRLGELLRSLTEFFRTVLKAAEGLIKLKREGLLSENMESWLDAAVGMDSDQQIERMAVAEVKQIAEDAGADSTFSIDFKGLDKAPSHYSYVRSSNISQKLEDIANREGIEFVEPSAGTPTRIAEFERDSGLKVGFFRKVREVATAQVDERTSAFVDPAQPFALLLNSEVDSPIDGLLAHEVMHAAQRDEQSGYKELEQDLVGLLSEGDAQDIEVFLEHRKYKKSQWEKERIAYIAGASMSHHQEMEISSLENVTAIKERIGKFFADSGQLNPNSIEGVDDADLSTFSLAPKGDPIVERVRGLMRDPDTRLVVYGKMADKLASIRRDADIHLVINGSSTVRPATAEYRTATSLRQEAAEMRRKAVSEAENKIYDTMGEILTNEEITRLSDQPVTSRILEEGGIESKSAAIKRHGNDLLIGGEYDDMAGLPPMYYGGTESTDQMAGILFNHGLITENSVPAMLEAIDKEITSVASNKELLTKAKARLRSVREDAKKESNEWLADKLKEQERDHSPRAILMRTMASYNAIISVLPAEIRGQVGGIMKMAGAKSESAAIKGLLERLERADNLLEKHLQKEYREKVSKAVDRAMPSKGKTSSVAKGKMVYNFTDELKKIAEVLSLSSMEVADAVEDAATRHEKSQTGEEIDEEAFADSTEDLARLVMYGNIHNTGTPVSASQMAEALNELEVLIRDGRTRWQARQEQEKARLSGVRNKTTDVITGGKGRVPSAEILKNKTKKQKSDYLKREHLRNMSFEFLLNSISRNDKSSETLGSYINKHFAPLVHTATHREHIQLAKRRDNLLQAVSSIYGIDSTKQGWKGKMEKLLAKHAKINFKSGVVRVEHEGSRTVEVTREDAQLAIDGITKHVHHGYSFVELTKKEIGELKTMLKEDASKERGQAKKKFKLVQKQEGVLREQALSQDIGMFLSMMHIQDDLRPAMEAHGYDSGVMDEIEGFLTDESKALRAWLFLEYKNIHPYVNKVFREHFGYSLPSKKNYAPAKFNHAGRDIKELIDEGHGVQSTTPGFAIERIRHKSAPRFDVGAVEAYMMHIEEAEHFVNWYEVVKELRSVFMNRDVRDHIKEQHGTEAYKLILERIDTFAQGGTMEGKNKFADHLRKTFTVAKLSYNWGVFLKQLTSLPAYSFDIPVAQYVKYQAEFFANPVKGYKLISGKDYTKQRFTQGYDRDIMAVMNAMNGGKGKLQKAAEFGMMFGRLGDIIPVIVGGYASYRYNYEQAIKSGKSEQEAGVMATLAFEMSTDRAQQSGNLKDQSHYSMGGSWSRVLTMFQTSPRQYYSNMAEAILDAKAGRKGGAKRAAKQAFIAHVVLPSLFYWTSVFTRNAFRDDDDKESLDEMLNGWYLSMLMGPTSGIFLWGQIVNEVVSGYEYSVPIMEWAGEIGDGGRRLHKMYSSYTDDDEATNVSPEDVIGFLDNMATAGSLAIGRSATWYDIGTSRAKSFGFTKDDVEYLAMSKEDQAVQDASSVHSKLYKEKLPDRETDSDAYDNAQDARFKALADEYLQIRNENRAEWPEIEKKLIEKGKLPKAVKEIMD